MPPDVAERVLEAHPVVLLAIIEGDYVWQCTTCHGLIWGPPQDLAN